MAVLRRRWRQWRRSWTGLACVGAGLVGGVEKTAELHAMTYKEFMKMTNKPDWAQAVKEVHERMVVMNVWRAVPREDVPKDAKVTTTTFSMKENANGRFRARVNTRDFMLKDGKHYNSDNISSPVTLLFVLCLCCLLFLDGQTNWLMWSVHSCAATFKRKTICVKVLKGFHSDIEGNWPQSTWSIGSWWQILAWIIAGQWLDLSLVDVHQWLSDCR